MKQKVIMVAIALVLILIIAGIGLGKPVLERYSYGTDYTDLAEYYEVTGDEVAIILQDHYIEDKALLRDGRVYFSEDTVKAYLTDEFYYAEDQDALLYTTATGTRTAVIGEDTYYNETETVSPGYVPVFREGDTLYLAAEYVKLYAKFDYAVFEKHLQLTTEWDTVQAMTVKKNTQIRELGGNKSSILRDVEKGETVELLEAMDTWSKVKTSDSFLGYIENKCLEDAGTFAEQEPMEPDLPEYTTVRLEGKVNLGFHAIGGVTGNSTLGEMIAEGRGMNVIAPTWFSLNSEDGSLRDFSSDSYVTTAHGAGLKVWAVVDNFNYELETGNAISDLNVLSSTEARKNLTETLVNRCVQIGVDGVNVDFEGLTSDCGVHFIQFLKELSVACRAAGLSLSVDNYVPFDYNDFYRLDIQGRVADYVLIMGYDEHYHNSGNPGSVASLSYVSNGLDKTLEMVPSEKVINALPFYMILWKTNGSTVTDEYITLNNLADFLSRTGVQPTWDEESGQNYAEWTSGTTNYQIWCEDAESISAKLNVMYARNLGGVGVWRLGYGTADVWGLVSAYASN